jgi:hypothetical protein
MLCEPCDAKWLRCLYAKPPPPPLRLMTTGRDLPRDIEAARQRRFSQHAEVVREYGKQLQRDCAAGRHVTEDNGSPASRAP